MNAQPYRWTIPVLIAIALTAFVALCLMPPLESDRPIQHEPLTLTSQVLSVEEPASQEVERDEWAVATESDDFPPAIPLDPLPSPRQIQEDDPDWDCRTMGNRLCGVDVKGTWYLIAFDENGQPIGVSER